MVGFLSWNNWVLFLRFFFFFFGSKIQFLGQKVKFIQVRLFSFCFLTKPRRKKKKKKKRHFSFGLKHINKIGIRNIVLESNINEEKYSKQHLKILVIMLIFLKRRKTCYNTKLI